MSILYSELLGPELELDELAPDHRSNIEILYERINQVRKAFGKPMKVTSGYRSMADHLRIYAQKGITDQSKIPMKSKHLYGQAVDIYDPKKELQAWVKKNEKLMEQIGFWFEDFASTPNWVHFQIVPPKSGKRFFIP